MIQIAVVVGIVVAIVLLIAMSTYNGLMQLRQEVRIAWAEMDEQLKNRYDLIPPLAKAVQRVGGEPVDKLPAITAAKNQAAVAFNPVQLAAAEAALTVAISDLLTDLQGSPSLQADPQISGICQQLQNCEKQIQRARARYNDRVTALNESLRSFPIVVTAKLIGLKPQPAF